MLPEAVELLERTSLLVRPNDLAGQTSSQVGSLEPDSVIPPKAEAKQKEDPLPFPATHLGEGESILVWLAVFHAQAS